MRYLPVLFLCLFFSERLPAQSTDWFAPMGATWTYYGWRDSPIWMYPDRREPFKQATVDKDSVIFGLPCRRLTMVKSDGTKVEESAIWIHTDSNRIFTLHLDTFLLFFDRSASVGDTLKLHAPINAQPYFDVGCAYYQGNNSNSMVVDSISLIAFAGENLVSKHGFRYYGANLVLTILHRTYRVHWFEYIW